MKLLKETKYLDFFDLETKNRKTKHVAVINKHHQEIIGEIKWFGKWRQYCFFPYIDTVWNRDCLKSIIEVINDLMLKHSKAKNLVITMPQQCTFREVSFYERLISTDERQISGYCCKHSKCTVSLLKKLKKDFLPCNDDKVFPKNCPL
jgi:hypothetical protein